MYNFRFLKEKLNHSFLYLTIKIPSRKIENFKAGLSYQKLREENRNMICISIPLKVLREVLTQAENMKIIDESTAADFFLPQEPYKKSDLE